jgi:hypothetical protein
MPPRIERVPGEVALHRCPSGLGRMEDTRLEPEAQVLV